MVEKAHRHGVKVGVYIYRGTEEEILQKMHEYYDMGVDYILTDYFLSAKREFDKRKGVL